MTDKERIIAEIERLKLCTMDEHMKFYCEEAEIEYNTLCRVVNLIKSLQEEAVSIWHDANQQPTMYRKYLVRYSDGSVSGSWERHDDGFISWEDEAKEHGSFTHWCYVKDLLKL